MADIYVDKKRDMRLVTFSQNHIGPVLRLMNQEGWYYYDGKELERYLKLNETCFTLVHDSEIIGSIFSTNYGNQAWLGNIVVSGKVETGRSPAEPAEFLYRNKGYAGKMIRHVMNILCEKGIQTFRLGSVPTAIGAYRKVGFQAESFTSAQEAALPIFAGNDIPTLDQHLTIEAMTLDDLKSGVIRIDEMYFKSNRSRLFIELFQDSIRKSCLCLKDRGRIVGYIMIRRRTLLKEEGGFAEGPDLVYRLGPSCVLPKYGIDGFKALFTRAIRPVNREVENSGMSARMYAVFPQNANRKRIYADFEALGGDSPEAVFNEHDHIFKA